MLEFWWRTVLEIVYQNIRFDQGFHSCYWQWDCAWSLYPGSLDEWCM